MSRGLSKQQTCILEMLRTDKHRDKGLTTQMIAMKLHSEYLTDASKGHYWFSRESDKYRVSVFRALQSLERRGLVKSVRCMVARQIGRIGHKTNKRLWWMN